jgi:hypothetical protein
MQLSLLIIGYVFKIYPEDREGTIGESGVWPACGYSMMVKLRG